MVPKCPESRMTDEEHCHVMHDQGLLFKDKDLSSKDKDNDCIVNDKDQDKDCILVLKESLRTRTNITDAIFVLPQLSKVVPKLRMCQSVQRLPKRCCR